MMRKHITLLTGLFLWIYPVVTGAQDTVQHTRANKPVEIFSSGKTINTRTPELMAPGKMEFNVTHNFGDVAGSNGGIVPFFGLDNAADIRIGFHIGVGRHTEVDFARVKGASAVQSMYEFGIKQRLMQQMEQDPSRPMSIAIYANAVIAAQKRNALDNRDNSFTSFSDRLSHVFQLILAKRFGAVSFQLNPTYMTRGYAISYDETSFFALGGAIKLPIIANRLNLVVDYFHTFRSQASKDSFKVNNDLTFYDPLGVGFEILTSGHIFRLNFTNAKEILENRFIPRTVTSWGKGEFRWGFTISRKFTLWRKKSK